MKINVSVELKHLKITASYVFLQTQIILFKNFSLVVVENVYNIANICLIKTFHIRCQSPSSLLGATEIGLSSCNKKKILEKYHGGTMTPQYLDIKAIG